MIDTIEAVLRPIRNSLQADGFDLKVEVVEDGVVSLVVLPGPEACIECLIPEEHFKLRLFRGRYPVAVGLSILS